jgi:hypothetical protein
MVGLDASILMNPRVCVNMMSDFFLRLKETIQSRQGALRIGTVLLWIATPGIYVFVLSFGLSAHPASMYIIIGLTLALEVLGMGGSTLGSHVIKALYADTLPVPVEIVNGYHVPASVTAKTLVIVSSYSGTTEEPVAAGKEALAKKAKVVTISSGGTLKTWAEKNK